MGQRKFQVTITVNEEDLISSVDETQDEAGTDREELNTIAMIYHEMAWTGSSGIHTVNVVEIPIDEEPLTTLWDFVQRYYPDYSKSDEIAQEGDLHKLVEKEYDDGDCADELLKSEYGNNIDNPEIYTDWRIANQNILHKAVESYIEIQKRIDYELDKEETA